MFVHDALLEATLSGNTEIGREILPRFVEKLSADEDLDGDEAAEPKTLLEKQFEASIQ